MSVAMSKPKPPPTLSATKPSARNPRKVTKRRLTMLQQAMGRFGDLSGIVVNKASNDEIVSGHQRREVLLAAGQDAITIERRYEPATHAGTTAEGFVILNGEKHAYREVWWPDPAMAAAAAIAANRGAGSWDMPLLTDLMRDISFSTVELSLTMFDEDERADLLGNEVGKIPEALEAAKGESKPIACPACGHEFHQARH